MSFYYLSIKRILPLFFLVTAIIPSKKTFAQQNGGKLSDLSFIVGNWKTTGPDRIVEGGWMGQDGDNMLGFMRMMSGNKATMYELLSYELSDKGLVSRVKHFKPGMIGMEEKDKFDQYNFVEATNGRVVLQKEGEDLRIIYEKRSDNQFAIMRGNLVDGKYAFKDLFVFNRVNK